MNHRKPRSGPGVVTGLFHWLADGEVALDAITANPILVACPACGASPRQQCQQPSRQRGGTRKRNDPHPSRVAEAGRLAAQPSTPEEP